MANQPCIPEVDLAAPQRMVLFFCNWLVSEGFLHVSSWQVGQVIFVLYVVLGIDVMLASEHEPSNPPLFLYYEQVHAKHIWTFMEHAHTFLAQAI